MGCEKLDSFLTFSNGYIGEQLEPAKGSKSTQLFSSAGIQEITLSPPRDLRSDKPQQGNDIACTVSITLSNSNKILDLDGWISWQKKSNGKTELIGVILSETQTDSEVSNAFKELTGYDAGIKPNGKKSEGTNYASFQLPVSGTEEYGAGQTIQGSADPPNCDQLATLFPPEKPTQPGTESGDGDGTNGGNECGEKNLLVNGDLSIGSFKNGANERLNSIAGWELTDKGEVWSSGFGGIDSTTGDGHFIELDALGTSGTPDRISQTVNTDPGTIYDLTLDLRRRNNQEENVIVTWSDQIKNQEHELGVVDAGTTTDWVKQTFSFQATSKKTTISLEEPVNENDSLGVLIDNINLTKACDQPTGNENNGQTADPDAPVVTKIVGRNIVEAPKRELQYTVTLNKAANKSFDLDFEIIPSETDNATPLSAPLGDHYDYLDGISNVGLTDNVTNNGDGTITVPAGVKTFSAFIPVQPDDIIEPAEITILQVGEKQGQAYIYDNRKNYDVETIEGGEVSEGETNGEPNRLNFNVKLNRPLQSTRRFSYFFGNRQETDDQDYAIAGINEAKSIDYLVGESNITIEGSKQNDIVPDPGTQTIKLKKGVEEFTISVPVVDDQEVENPETVLLQVGATQGTATILDNDLEEPLKVTTVFANSTQEGEERQLTYQVTFNKSSLGGETFDFSLTSEAPCFGGLEAGFDSSGNEVDYLHGFDNNNPTAISFNNGVTLQSINNGSGTLILPSGINRFEVTVPIVDDTVAEETETVILGISQEVSDNASQSFVEAPGQIFDNDSPTPELQVDSIIASSVQEGDGRDLEYTITLNQVTTSEETFEFDVIGGSPEFVAIGGADPEDGKTDYLNGEAVTFTSLGGEEDAVVVGENFVLDPDNKTLSIPTGIGSFKVSIPVVDDSRVENTETATLEIDDETGIGQIFDNDAPEEDPVIIGVKGDSVVESGINPLTFTVELSKTTSEETRFSYQLGGTAVGAESFVPGEVDYLTGEKNTKVNPKTIYFEDGEGPGDQQEAVVVVPKGVNSFRINSIVPNDNIAEPTKEVELTVGGKTGTAKIFDDDTIVGASTPVGIKAITANSVREGDGNAIAFYIQLNKKTPQDIYFRFNIDVSGDQSVDLKIPDTTSAEELGIEVNNVEFENENHAEGIIKFTRGNDRGVVLVDVIDDEIVEGTETVTLRIIDDNSTGVAQIYDNDSIIEAETQASISSITANSVQEGDGESLTYTIRLSKATNKETEFSYSIEQADGFDLATGAATDVKNQVDYLNGKENIIFTVVDEENEAPPNPASNSKEFKIKNTDAANIIIVPEGISEFAVSVPVIDDTLIENTEKVVLKVGGKKGTGAIYDNDSFSTETYQLKANAIQATSVKEGDTTENGVQKPLEYTITLNQDTTDDARELTFSVSEESTAIGANTDDGQTIDYLNGASNVVFSSDEGEFSSTDFTLSDGTITLPVGIRRFTATVPVIDDTRVEETETAILKIDELEGIGQIFDNDNDTKAIKISASSVVEGDSNNPNLKYEVTLNQATTQETLIPFSVTGDAIGGPIEVAGAGIDYLNGQNVTLSGGVTVINNTDGTKSVKIPAGVSSFTADVPVVDDDILEETETAILNIGKLKGIGEIFDNDSQILIKNPEVVSIGATSVLEGDGNLLTYTIAFNTALFEDTELGFSVAGDATGGPSIAAGIDYLNGTSNVVFSRADIKFENGKVTIPKGVSTFTASVPVVDDSEVEPTETAILKIGNLEGVGQIFDNNTPIAGVNAQSIQATSVQEGDGRNLIYTVTLNQATTTNTDLAFTVSGDAIGAPTNTPNQVDYLNGNNVILSGGVINNGNGTVTIPTGVTSFTASVPVIDDTLVESTEEAILKIGDLEGIGQIFDNDTNQNSGGGSGGGSQAVDLSVVAVYGDAVQEGDGKKLTYTVVLNRQTTESSNLTFSVGGDAIGAPIDSPNEVDYLTGSSNVTLSGGVTNNGNGTVTIPAGVTSFTATVPVIDDTLAEDTETAVLSVGNRQGTGQIFDNDDGAKPARISAKSVREGDGQKLIFTVDLGQSTIQTTVIAFSIAGDATSGVDYINIEDPSAIELSDGVTGNRNENGIGSFTIPAGVSSFTASVPIIDDTLPEDTELVLLQIGDLQGIGEIYDNDQDIDPIDNETVPQIKLIQANAVLEGDGNDLIYKVKLDQKPKKKLRFAFNIGGDATFDLDYETGKKVTLTNGVKNKQPGSITVPAGVKSFKAKVPVIDDNLVEATESASIHFGRVSAVGQIFDNDSLRANGNDPGPSGSSDSEGPQTTNPGSNDGDGDALNTKATLSLTSNGNGLEVKGDKGSSLWLALDVLYANDIMQNNLVIVNRNGDGLGTLGSTPKPLQNLGSSFRGSKHLLLHAGDEIYFRQASDNEPINEFPLFELNRIDGNGFQLSLEDNRPDGGRDFNDLVVSIQPIQKPKDQELVEMAGIQRRTHDGLFDLSDLGQETTLTLTTLNNSGGDVLIGLVPVTGSQGAGFSVDGKDPRDGQRFEKAIRDNLIDPEQDSEETSGKTITASWSLGADDAGLYAPVLITEDDDVMTFGRRFGSTSDQRLKVLGENVVGFELSAKDNRSDQEWHYDDVIVEALLG